MTSEQIEHSQYIHDSKTYDIYLFTIHIKDRWDEHTSISVFIQCQLVMIYLDGARGIVCILLPVLNSSAEISKVRISDSTEKYWLQTFSNCGRRRRKSSVASPTHQAMLAWYDPSWKNISAQFRITKHKNSTTFSLMHQLMSSFNVTM